MIPILLGFLPSIIARKAIKARDQVVDAFVQYYRAGGHESASLLARSRYEVAKRNGVPLKDIARFEVVSSVAVLVNTVPASFWLLFLIFATPGLLEEIRGEVDAVTKTTTVDGKPCKELDITGLKGNCPLLLSTYQEVLRWRSVGTSVREVTEDIMLNDQWLLKKGAMLQMPTRVLHQDASLWGLDVEQFNPRRFMKGEKQQTENGKRPNDVCFRSFGGGKTLCPGRNFATNEILAFVSVFVARYDMVPEKGREWVLPTTDNSNAASVMMSPDYDVPARISKRAGFEQCKWSITLEKAGKGFALVVEDLEN